MTIKRILILFITITFVFAIAYAGSSNKTIAEKAEDVQPLKVGDSIPDGTVKTMDGKEVSLRSLIQKPTVLIFYRGGWCPYCSTQMGQLVKLEPKLLKMGFQLLAISADRPEKLKESLNKQHVNYTLLSDSPMKMTQQFGLAFKLSDKTLKDYKDWGLDVEGDSGQKHHILPVPAAYLVDTKGIIRFAYYNPDYTVRIKPKTLLNAAKKMASTKRSANK